VILTRLRQAVCGAAVGTTALVVVVGAAAGASAQRQAKLTSITFASTNSLAFLTPNIAKYEGFFRKHGLDATINFGGDAATNIIAGNADLAVTGDINVVNAITQGKALKTLMLVTQRGSGHFVCRSNLGLNASAKFPANISGIKTPFSVGITAPSATNIVLSQTTLDAAGYQLNKDYSFVSLGTGGNISAALEANQVECAVSFAPFSFQEIQRGAVINVVNQLQPGQGPAILNGWNGNAIIAKASWIEANPATAKAVIAALTDTMTWMRDPKHFTAVVNILSTVSGVEPSIVKLAVPSILSSSYPTFSCVKEGAELKLFATYKQLTIRPACDTIIARGITPVQEPPKTTTTKK
jgi:ABC-type nitrate/sulfonate/bicarbonate transport system substrate-binding protein